MGTYYIKGGSRYNEANPKVWVTLFLGGFDDSKYTDTNWKDIDYDFGGAGSVVTTQDPFWRLGGSSGGAKELELGLWNDYRVKFETTGITYWDGDSWEDLLPSPPAPTLAVGSIIMFSGSFTNNVTMVGWYICDGNNGTVNLVNKFVRGGSTSGTEGGSDDAIVVSHAHTTVAVGNHGHNIYQGTGSSGTLCVQRAAQTTPVWQGGWVSGAGGHGHTINGSGVSGAGKNVPTYYTLIFIQRMS